MSTTLWCLGINHRTAPVALRERLVLGEEEIRALLARLGCGEAFPPSVGEAVILSTCNRTEWYVVGPDEAAVDDLVALWAELKAVPPTAFAARLYRWRDEDAIHHLFRVAAGLDSMVLGEPQILGQVTRALELARGQGTVRAVLGHLFQAAIHAGKRVRTETALSRNPASVASMAVRLAADTVGDLTAARVLVVGAGEMAEATVEALRKRGVRALRVVNRTLARAQALAERWQAEAMTFEHLRDGLAWADVVVSSTGAPHTLLHRPDVADAMQRRPNRPLLILDIALPRDVDAEVGQVPGVRLVDLDGLQEHLEEALAARRAAVPHAERILEEELARFLDYYRSLAVHPVLVALRRQAEAVRQAELEKTLRRMPHLSEEDRRRLDALTRALVNKLLHAPMTALREAAQGPRAAEVVLVARRLFDLPLETAGPDLSSDAAPQDMVPARDVVPERREI